MSHPTIIRDNVDGHQNQYDVYSRLLEDRIICLDGVFEDGMASIIVSQLLILSNKSEEEIKIYINSPGGAVTSGLAIYDTMQMIPNVIKTIVIGHACSMGSFILSAGTKGHRYATPSSRIMIHMASVGMQGTTKDVEIRYKEQKRLNDYLNERLATHCGKKIKEIEDATDRDKFMTAKESKEFGIIDDVLMPNNKTAWK